MPPPPQVPEVEPQKWALWEVWLVAATLGVVALVSSIVLLVGCMHSTALNPGGWGVIWGSSGRNYILFAELRTIMCVAGGPLSFVVGVSASFYHTRCAVISRSHSQTSSRSSQRARRASSGNAGWVVLSASPPVWLWERRPSSLSSGAASGRMKCCNRFRASHCSFRSDSGATSLVSLQTPCPRCASPMALYLPLGSTAFCGGSCKYAVKVGLTLLYVLTRFLC